MTMPDTITATRLRALRLLGHGRSARVGISHAAQDDPAVGRATADWLLDHGYASILRTDERGRTHIAITGDGRRRLHQAERTGS